MWVAAGDERPNDFVSPEALLAKFRPLNALYSASFGGERQIT